MEMMKKINNLGIFQLLATAFFVFFYFITMSRGGIFSSLNFFFYAGWQIGIYGSILSASILFIISLKNIKNLQQIDKIQRNKNFFYYFSWLVSTVVLLALVYFVVRVIAKYI